MKKNLFRGKGKDNGEWIVGYYVCLNEKSHRIYTGYAETDCGIYYPDYCEVIPETVGRYIGLNDKNCREICEGDIVHAIYKSGYTGIPDKDFGIGVIKYSGTHYSGAAYQIDIIGEPGCRIFSASLQVEVIGNVHDNPELLKKE